MAGRWAAALIAVCVISLSGCRDNVMACKPSPPPVQVDVTSLQPRTAMLRTCRNDQCHDFFALSRLGERLSMASHSDLPATLRLDVAVAGRIVQSYEIRDLTLREPSGKNCDPGESVILAPSPDGKLTVVTRYDTKR
ncbi:hypothetical protein [Kribbella monticola]|uniref:hypothetical protein n=1 Tax=Kribbella monticola TaxID=2185285 RepID=UPI000DD2C12C|nr:hypothetical protein [Kribbella monticola]